MHTYSYYVLLKACVVPDICEMFILQYFCASHTCALQLAALGYIMYIERCISCHHFHNVNAFMRERKTNNRGAKSIAL